MPMRLYRASKARFGSHVSDNLRPWTGIFAVLTALGIFLFRIDFLGAGNDGWAHVFTFAALVLGVLIIMISHEGYEAPDADEGTADPME